MRFFMREVTENATKVNLQQTAITRSKLLKVLYGRTKSNKFIKNVTNIFLNNFQSYKF